MEAFKKRQKQRCQSPCLGDSERECAVDCYDAHEEGWREALEWLRETMEEIEKYDIPISGQEVIEKELEEK